MVLLASLMGLAFNASNPLGVRWNEPPPEVQEFANDTGAGAADAPLAPLAAAPEAGTAGATSPVTIAASGAEAPATGGRVFAAPSQISWAEVKPLAETGRVILVDVRSKAAYDAGHIPGAILLPEDSSDEAIRAFRDRVGTDAHLVFYCSSVSCSLSFKLAYRLARDYGFTRVQFMTGGYLEYQRSLVLNQTVSATPANPDVSGGPGVAAPAAVVSGTPSPSGLTPPVLESAPNPSPSAAPPASGEAGNARAGLNPVPTSWRRAAEWRQDHGALLVDARSAAAFVAGHVPGAVSLPADSGPEQLAVFAAQYARQVPLIIYGEARGDLKAFLLARKLLQEEGFENVRFTDDGYREWLGDPNQAAVQASPAVP